MVAQLTMPVLPRFGVPMQGYVFLALAIIAEVIATTALKSVDGLNKPLPLLLVVVGYALAFAMLALVMRSIPVGVAYALWSGLGIVLISLAAWLEIGTAALATAVGFIPAMEKAKANSSRMAGSWLWVCIMAK